MTNGDYQQIEAYKNVIDWLNDWCGLSRTTRKRQVKADWSNGKVATTGISYLGDHVNGRPLVMALVIIAKQVFPHGTTTIGKMVW